MTWQTPKTDWTGSDSPTPSTLNRIERNILELKQAATIDIADTAGNFDATNVEDALQELAGNVSSGKAAVASAIYAMGQQANGSMTFAELAAKIRDISDDATATVNEVLVGKTFYQGGAKRTGTMPNRGAVTITPTTSDQAILEGYHNGQGKVSAVTFDASKVLTGTTIAGKAGTMPNRGAVVITPGATTKPIPAGYHNGEGYVETDPNLVPENIVREKTIFGVEGASYPHPGDKYWMMRQLQLINLSAYNPLQVRLSPNGDYIFVACSNRILLLKRSGESWSIVSELAPGTIGSSGFCSDVSSEGTYIVATLTDSGIPPTAKLIKRVGDTLSVVSSCAISDYADDFVGDLTFWDPTNTYIIGFTHSFASVLKRSGDSLSRTSIVYHGKTSSGTLGTPDNALEFVGTSNGLLLRRSGESISVANSNAIANAAFTPSGNYAVVVTGTYARLYRRDSYNLVALNRYLHFAGDATNVFNIRARMQPGNVFPIARNHSDSTLQFIPFVILKVDEAAEQIYPVYGGLTMHSMPSARGMLSAQYSRDGQYLAAITRDSQTLYVYKVGEL